MFQTVLNDCLKLFSGCQRHYFWRRLWLPGARYASTWQFALPVACGRWWVTYCNNSPSQPL